MRLLAGRRTAALPVSNVSDRDFGPLRNDRLDLSRGFRLGRSTGRIGPSQVAPHAAIERRG